MIYIYTLFNLCCLYIGWKCYAKIVNPIGLYCVVWQVALTLHESNLIMYYDLSWATWATLFGMQALYVCGCLLGKKLACLKGKKTEILKEEENSSFYRRQLKLYLIVTICLASIGIVGNAIIYMQYYGFDLWNKLSDIYYDRVHNVVSITAIPYFGSIIYVSLSLLGLYLKKYGFTFLTVPVVVLIILMALVSAARADMVFALLIITVAYLTAETNKQRANRIQTLKNCLLIMIFLLIALVCFVFLTSKRGGVVEYVTDLFISLFGENVVAYKLITYAASPIGVLNEYLKTCEFQFGQNTFLPIFNILSNLGLMERIDQYQEFFNTPIACNVGTWYRELIEDFTYVGALIAVLLFAIVASCVFEKSKCKTNVKCKILFPIIACVICLSFFDWKLRSATIWISLFVSYIIGLLIERKIKSNKFKDSARCCN